MEDGKAWNSAEKALSVVTKVVLSDGARTLREIADDLNMTVPTIYRHVSALTDRGFLTRLRRGTYVPGPTLQAISKHCSKRKVMHKIARPILAKLANKLNGVCHMATWDDEMVTYIIKSVDGKKTLFTQETMQLEGYCSGLGKVLLSILENNALETYLNSGPFLSITQNTITDPDKLREEIHEARKNQYAMDNSEMQEGLVCLAVPIVSDAVEFPLAISISRGGLPSNYFHDVSRDLHELRKVASSIASLMAGVFNSGDLRG